MSVQQIVILGGGIGGLTTALALHQRGVACRVYEAVPVFQPIGVGINILPHATKVLAGLGVLETLEKQAVLTQAASFYNRFGQLIYEEPLGRFAGYETPQLSIHRADLHSTLRQAVVARLGPESIVMGHRTSGVEQTAGGVRIAFLAPDGTALPSVEAAGVIAADGIHSAIRKQFHPAEGLPRYSGVNMWRGTTRWKPFLVGANMVRAGWLTTGKMVIYPIRNNIDAEGRQLINWVAELETPNYQARDWTRAGRLEDFLPAFADWHFDWLDVPAMIKAASSILEFPMVDQDPLLAWTYGRVTLLGDAAHPMVPRGSNGAGQSIIDAKVIADRLAASPDVGAAFRAYEQDRLGPTSEIVLTNRTRPPDAILGEVYRRSGDKPFARVEDVISRAEIEAISEGYKRVAGYSKAALKG
jgi:5-methylphenazine-1-carboxylate 1-monooxygenase